MNKRRSIKWIIVWRFVVYTLGLLLLCSLVGSYLGINDTSSDRLIVLDNMIVISCYIIGVKFFSYSISKKIIDPVKIIEQGFREVSKGNLEVVIDFKSETEFKEMRDSFNSMVKNLKESEEQRVLLEGERLQLFVSIAHDLKTPMTTISGYSDALANGLVEEKKKQQEYYELIKMKANQMNRLIDQLLHYSRMSSSGYQLHIVSIDLAELIRVVCATEFDALEVNQMELDLNLPESPLFWNVDKFEISRALNNLLINAIQHNPAGSLISVSLEIQGNHVIISIADNGSEIPGDKQKTVFEPFVSGNQARSSGSGTGLGLAIVKRAAILHGGSIEITKSSKPYVKMFVFKIPNLEL